MDPCRLCRLYGRNPVAPKRKHVCEACRSDFAAALDALAARSPHGVLEVECRGPSEYARRVPGPRYPVSIEVLSAMGPQSMSAPPDADQVPGPANAPALSGWCTEIAEWRSEPEPRAWHRDRALWLKARLDWLCESFPAVSGLARDVDSADRAMARLSGDGPTRHPIGRCTRAFAGGPCGQRLEASVWDKSVVCPRCDSAWPRREWSKLATEMSKETAA